MSIALLLLFALLAFPPATAASDAPSVPTGLLRDVTFAAWPPLADNAELLRRLVSPLNTYRIKRKLGNNPAALAARPLDPEQQHFALYVPPGPPPAEGYALLVFVPPWDDARVPHAWIPALDRHHVIFVSAAHSGNDANVLDRREPLALLAEFNVAKRYRIDPVRIYVGGFSGGSRVALRLALAYPDVFRGALLDAGSDPIGTAQVPLPPADLLHEFQQATRIVLLTGDRDALRQAMAARASDSLQRWCVFDRDDITLPMLGHDLADAGGFSHALDALTRPALPPDPARLAACRADHVRAMDAGLARVQSLLDHGQRKQARDLLEDLDASFGGLAAPRSVTLLRSLDTQADTHAVPNAFRNSLLP